jgi:AbrB family looped-hinge helix DNA binding protein
MSITQIDANGRVLLPLGIRYQLDLNDGDELVVDELGDGTIILKKIDRGLRFQEWLNKELSSSHPTSPVSKDAP